MLPASTTVPPARFAPLPAGWHVSTDAPVLLLPRGTQATTLATNWVVNLAARDGWSAQLHPGRVAIDVVLLRTRSGCGGARDALAPLRLPLLLSRAARATLEGSQLAEDRLAGRRPGYDVDLRIDYGSAQPSRAIRRRVQRVLSSLRLPTWPARC